MITKEPSSSEFVVSTVKVTSESFPSIATESASLSVKVNVTRSSLLVKVIAPSTSAEITAVVNLPAAVAVKLATAPATVRFSKSLFTEVIAIAIPTESSSSASRTPVMFNVSRSVASVIVKDSTTESAVNDSPFSFPVRLVLFSEASD